MKNGIDFNERLDDLKVKLHARIDYRFDGYFPMPLLTIHETSCDPWDNIMWVKFDALTANPVRWPGNMFFQPIEIY